MPKKPASLNNRRKSPRADQNHPTQAQAGSLQPDSTPSTAASDSSFIDAPEQRIEQIDELTRKWREFIKHADPKFLNSTYYRLH